MISKRLLGSPRWLVGFVFVLAACGSSEPAEIVEAPDESPVTTEPSGQAADDTAPTTVEEPTTEAPVEDVVDDSAIQVSGGVAGPWTTTGGCAWNPDASGVAAIVWEVFSSEANASDGEVTVLFLWPLVIEDDSEPGVLGSIVEPDGNLLLVIGAEASSDGSTLTVLADVSDGLTVTITCDL